MSSLFELFSACPTTYVVFYTYCYHVSLAIVGSSGVLNVPAATSTPKDIITQNPHAIVNEANSDRQVDRLPGGFQRVPSERQLAELSRLLAAGHWLP